MVETKNTSHVTKNAIFELATL